LREEILQSQRKIVEDTVQQILLKDDAFYNQIKDRLLADIKRDPTNSPSEGEISTNPRSPQ
jgi:hypothetical protein